MIVHELMGKFICGIKHVQFFIGSSEEGEIHGLDACRKFRYDYGGYEVADWAYNDGEKKLKIGIIPGKEEE